MNINRTRLIEKLIQLANRMAELQPNRYVQYPYTLAELIRTEADPMIAECGTHAAILVTNDGDAMAEYGWLEAAAELGGFDSVRDLLVAHDIGAELVEQIYLGKYGEAPPDTTEPPAARVYKAILASLQSTTRALLTSMPAVIIRSDEATCIDEMARNAAQAVVIDLEL